MKINKKVKEFYPDDFDNMVDDVYDQVDPSHQEAVFDQSEDFVGPETGSLKDISQYNMDDEAEEDFDVNYRTPTDASIKDLIPTDYNIMDDDEKGPTGSFSQKTGEIDVRSERYLKKAYPNENPKTKQVKILAHEGIHEGWFDIFETENGRARQKDIRMQSDYDLQTLETGAMNNSLGLEGEAIYNKELDNVFAARSKLSDSKKSNKHRKSVESIYPRHQQLNEGYAYFGSRFPSEVINPTTKVGRRLNRMKYKDAPIWGMEV